MRRSIWHVLAVTVDGGMSSSRAAMASGVGRMSRDEWMVEGSEAVEVREPAPVMKCGVRGRF